MSGYRVQRVRSAYIFFMREYRNQNQKKGDLVTIVREAAEVWKKMPENQKLPYVTLA